MELNMQRLHRARNYLGQLSGWLNGLVEAAQFEAKIHAEAEAYARERVKGERPAGFDLPGQ